ncbi:MULTISPECIES: hypothetical protein [unclassified Bartonella]|uniref:hypothetical protein n=1 Tax=unclassified Bartonella TaxID=2645622 RepID=UPI0009C277B7|nr:MULTISPECIES: hypothetical protein [unclassified Bartonella]AQX17974.1 hypothetical protein BA1379B_001270 [Bartonella sp. A1379B]AQX22486.1 hypothetical protein Bho11B_004640 [Bartonella sp. 11B]AQX24232.1 hypothetical protein Bho114_009130 [Bartonella sp. 114]AQX24935.1 hypothetical protein Bco22_002380 [Bartonella sp. Coyote22sub2]
MQSIEKVLIIKNLHSARDNLCNYVRNVGKSDDLSLLLDTERGIVKNDLLRYANSQGMISSLKTAISEINVVKDHIKLVSNSETYDVINRGYSFQKS